MSTPTRFKELCYRNDAPGLWRIVTSDTDSAIGPFYATKAELLADIDRYAREYGCMGAYDSEIVLLRAENERLREALASIAIEDCLAEDAACRHQDGHVDLCATCTARAALGKGGAR